MSIEDFPVLYKPHIEVCGIPEKLIIVGGGETQPKMEWLEPGYKIISINCHVHDSINKYLKDRYEILTEYTFHHFRKKATNLRDNNKNKYPIVYFDRRDYENFNIPYCDFKIDRRDIKGLGIELMQCIDDLKKVKKIISTGILILPWLKCEKVKKVILVGFDGWKNKNNNDYITIRSGHTWITEKSLHHLNIEFNHLLKYEKKLLINDE
jgi:hypothetical protein